MRGRPRQHFCARGHSLDDPENVKLRDKGKWVSRSCRTCERERDRRKQRIRKDRAAQGMPTTTDALTPADAERQLEAAVRLECAPPWERHPVPWD